MCLYASMTPWLQLRSVSKQNPGCSARFRPKEAIENSIPWAWFGNKRTEIVTLGCSCSAVRFVTILRVRFHHVCSEADLIFEGLATAIDGALEPLRPTVSALIVSSHIPLLQRQAK